MNNESLVKGEAIPMDCATFENFVHDLDRPGTSAAAQCEGALAHAESCPNCAALLTQVGWLNFSLLKLSEISTGRQPSPRLEAAVLREFRRTKDLAARSQIRLRLAALAVAAALFLALGLALRHRSVPTPAPIPDVAANSQHEPLPPGSAPIAPTATPSIAHRSPAPAPTNDVDEPVDTPDAASFVRLPYADDSAALDGGAIVRVVLPRAALASFGLPVADTGDSQRILADLIVSADGTPEAIRLLSDANASQEF